MQRGLTAFQLKLLGISLMVLDHVHQMFVVQGAPMWLTMAGRVVAPIFLFLSAEGFYYTRNKLAYLKNLLVGFWIMSLIQQLLSRALPNDDVQLMNNIFGTLFLAVLFMYAIDLIKVGMKGKERQKWVAGVGIILAIIGYAIGITILFSQPATIMFAVYATMVIPNLLFVEGGFLLVVLAVLFYLFRGNKVFQIIVLALVALVSTSFSFQGLFSSNFQWMMVFAAIPIGLYNGKEGRKMKWFFYVFYPTHLIILYVAATLLF